MSPPLEFRDGQLRDAQGETVAWPRLLLFGDPVAHSLSPRMHDAALRAARLPGEYRAVRVDTTELSLASRAAFEAEVTGVNLTVPHKVEILSAVARQSEEVAVIGAANTLVRGRGGWNAHNTDARGFALALQAFLGRDLEAALEHVCIIGAGGAARAVASAIRSVSVGARVDVLARRPESADWAEGFRAKAWPLDSAELGGATLVVQATPLGLRPDDPNPLGERTLPEAAVAVDLVHAQEPTRFLRDAVAAGCRAEGGGRMLVAQGALAFTMWFGGESPLRVMADAIDFDW